MLKRCARLFAFLLVAAAVLPGGMGAQEFRATITGTVTDSSKALVGGAIVSVRNLDTNEVLTTKTDAHGVYSVPYLHPGQRLVVSAEAPGFKTSIYPAVVLNISQKQTANFMLQVGGNSESVEVVSTVYETALDTEKADRGNVVDNRTITEEPLDGRNPLSLMDYMAGVTNNLSVGSQGVANNMLDSSYYSINGGKNDSTEFTIDGAPDNAIESGVAVPAAIPSVDAIQEFKVITTPYDAQFGRTAGGVVSMELKSGTNLLHGAAYEFAKRGYLDANSWGNNYNGLARPGHTEDQYGFVVSGPVFIPHLYDGRNKTFFMFNMEKFKQKLPQYSTYDLPNAQWLKGDFSNFTDASGALIPVFDPSEATTANPVRSIFQNGSGQYNHVDPSRFNPIAVNALNLILASSQPTALPNTLPWESIYVNTQPTTGSLDNYIVKIDEVLGSKDRLSMNYIHDKNVNQTLAGPLAVWVNGSSFTEHHMSTAVDWIHNLRSNLLVDVKIGYQRLDSSNGEPIGWNYDPTQLGFASSLISQLPLQLGFPQIRFNMQQQNSSSGGWIGMSASRSDVPTDTYSAAPTITWNKGRHSIRTGLDFRDTHYVYIGSSTNTLSIASNGLATSEYWNQNDVNDIKALPNGTALSQQSGNAILDFLIGQPNSVSVANQVFPYYTWHYWAPWVQDDWKVTPRLTLNLGLRYDLNGPPTVRHNWLNTGFDLNAVSPLNSAVNHTQFPNLPAITGGFTFPGTSGTNQGWAKDWSKYQPRIGFSYNPQPTTVIRGGIGRLVQASMGARPTASGFTNNPVYVNSNDGGRTYLPNNLGNPFPAGLPPIPGASLGLMTFAGQSVSFINTQYKLPSVIQASLGVEQAMPLNGKLEISYVGSRGYDQDVTYTGKDENYSLYKSCNDTLGTAQNPNPKAQCQNLTTNPFYGVNGVTGTLGTSKTTSLYQLARPHPQFTGITETLNNWGKTWYNSLQTTYRQRMKWEQINASWTWSKSMQGGGYVDAYYLTPNRSIAQTDRANRVTVTSVLNAPVGRGLKYFATMSRPADYALGGWELGTSYFWETGMPIYIFNSTYNIVGNLRGQKVNAPNTIDLGLNKCIQRWTPGTSTKPGSFSIYTGNGQSQASCGQSVALQQVAPYAPHTAQQYSDAARAPGTYQLDINLAKTIKFTERVRMQLRLEETNVLNHPTWYNGVDTYPTDSTYGTVSKPLYGQSNNPREGQLGVKVLW